MSAPHPGLPALRVGVAVAVPVLALTAHGMASGSWPTSAGVMVCVALGAALAALVGAPRGLSPTRTATLLAVGQVIGHPAAGVGDAAAGHSAHVGTMLAWHAVAVPASAVLLVLVARCYALVTAVLQAVASAPRLVVVGALSPFLEQWWPRTVVVGAGVGPRAPPVLA
ncbi:hypothetical protein [Gordonia sp. UBA7599]|uniref:hypothetical protein n=1 Tax=unclassified Gordonia (in: high G+C Gram-positive bacteria) TaxID=2657482 RepID=UPI000FA1E1EB|nr:hypothetical protein [Gordonia sp. UBA7599]RUP41704.1 MAG: hypothetical protein EKK60_00175 [Gordonia sp. (in: high G+C Gram-positive bacteria)]HNP57838.1 hypothetical protein [Gordonia sp. (in: high G+C Gram-positive bacteria)]